MSVRVALLALGVGLLGMESARACSAAFFTGEDSKTGQEIHMDGRSTDLSPEAIPNPPKPSIVIFPRGTAHDGNTIKGDLANPAKWTSLYGNLVVDSFGDGVNEKGLAIHGLLQMDSTYQTSDGSTSCVSSFKVIPYLLDNAATVAECLDLLGKVLVVEDKMPTLTDGPGGALDRQPLRWAIRDSSNDMAIVEYVNAGTEKKPVSKMMVYHGQEYRAATNEPTYDKQLKYYKKFAAGKQGQGDDYNGKKGLGGDYNAEDRFVRLMMFGKTLTTGEDTWGTVTNVFALMSTVWTIPGSTDYSMKEYDPVDPNKPKGKKKPTRLWPTIWQSVTDLDQLVFYMKVKKLQGIFWIDLKKIDFETLKQTGTLYYTNDPTLIGEANGKFTWQ